jgi:hypothetical protein
MRSEVSMHLTWSVTINAALNIYLKFYSYVSGQFNLERDVCISQGIHTRNAACMLTSKTD